MSDLLFLEDKFVYVVCDFTEVFSVSLLPEIRGKHRHRPNFKNYQYCNLMSFGISKRIVCKNCRFCQNQQEVAPHIFSATLLAYLILSVLGPDEPLNRVSIKIMML